MNAPRAFVFPGQGSHKVGMGRDLSQRFAAARSVFDLADRALGFSLTRLCFEGPEEELRLTANAQPAILATSLAALAAYREAGLPEACVVAGHSLGEYSALVAAGALALGDALLLVRRRGELMQEAVPVGSGAMAAVLGLSADAVASVATRAARESGEVCEVANWNSPEQTVIAGHQHAVARAGEAAKQAGAKRVLPLQVSAPFHCSLMRPAREKMAPLLAATALGAPRVPVVCNVDAVVLQSGDAARDALVRQIDSGVRWVESVRLMVDRFGVATVVELGPGNVLAGLVRRIAPGVATHSVGDAASLDELIAGAP